MAERQRFVVRQHLLGGPGATCGVVRPLRRAGSVGGGVAVADAAAGAVVTGGVTAAAAVANVVVVECAGGVVGGAVVAVVAVGDVVDAEGVVGCGTVPEAENTGICLGFGWGELGWECGWHCRRGARSLNQTGRDELG